MRGYNLNSFGYRHYHDKNDWDELTDDQKYHRRLNKTLYVGNLGSYSDE